MTDALAIVQRRWTIMDTVPISDRDRRKIAHDNARRYTNLRKVPES